MTDTDDDDREVDFVLVEPDEDAAANAETGFVIVEDADVVAEQDPEANVDQESDEAGSGEEEDEANSGEVDAEPAAETAVVPAEDAPVDRPAVVRGRETGFVVRDVETEETGFVVVRDTELVPAGDPTRNYPAVIEDVETDFVLVESEDDAATETDFVLVDDVEQETGLVPVDPAEYALEPSEVDPKRNGHR